jgi:hypothetical protein
VSACPRCGEELDVGQEYCVECGLRLPGGSPLGAAEDPGKGWLFRALAGLAVALAGAAVAVAATGGTGGGTRELVTATGGFARAPTSPLPGPSTDGQEGILEWPAGQDGWTIALATLPQADGKKKAVARAREAGRRGLTSVGVLDSSRFASLHPGYWLVFAGIYASEAEATSALHPARRFARTAGVRRIVP